MNEVDRSRSSVASKEMPEIPEIPDIPEAASFQSYDEGGALEELGRCSSGRTPAALPNRGGLSEFDGVDDGVGTGSRDRAGKFWPLRGTRGRTGKLKFALVAEDGMDDDVDVRMEGDGMDEGGEGNAEKLIALSASPDAFVSSDGFGAWREGCREWWSGSAEGRDMSVS